MAAHSGLAVPRNQDFQVCCLIGHLASQVKHCTGSSPPMNVDYMRPSPSHNTLLSSMTVFRDSIHIGSISPSSKIHLGPSWEMLASSLMMEEKSPVRNHRWLLFQHWSWLSAHSFPALATTLTSCSQTGQTQLCILLYLEPDTCV